MDCIVFGAVCAPAAVLHYDALRERGGMAYYVLEDGTLEPNPRYRTAPTPERLVAVALPELGLEPGVPVARVLEANPARFEYVSTPSSQAASRPAATNGGSVPPRVAGSRLVDVVSPKPSSAKKAGRPDRGSGERP